MKKILMLLVAVLLAATMFGCSNTPKEQLKVYSWGVYIDPDVITEFEREFNCKVIYDTFESNEQMYTKLMGGENYDVLVPSDYMIERLIAEDQLLELDLSKIENFDTLIPGVTNRSYDPGNKFSVPYFWGTVGLLYNTTKVDEAVLMEQGWSILANTDYKGRIFIYDSERDAFMIALKALGYSANTTVQAEIDEAALWLTNIAKTMDPVYVTDDSIDAMIAGNKDIAVMYSGDAAYILTENEEMSFFMPNEGTNLWVDGMVIYKNSQNVDLAHAWINFMLNEDVAAANSSYVGYTSPVQAVYDEMIGVDGEYEGNIAYEPRLGYEFDESFKNNEAMRKVIADLWTRIKSN
ncbi:MAG: ABC transporter substrate-binding protein [Erysipelotrichaceae bacterium]|nr:ABC transporter substrate-binding protein [Erysipelotrichaceae bacterium]